MLKHSIDICPDDPAELARHLDALTEGGAEIVNVIWQPRRVQEGDQSAAFDTSGSFLVISRRSALAEVAALDDQAGTRAAAIA